MKERSKKVLKRSVRIIDAILEKEAGRDIKVLPELIRMSGVEVEVVSLGGNTSKYKTGSNTGNRCLNPESSPFRRGVRQ